MRKSILALCALALFLGTFGWGWAGEQWPGVDEAVVKRFAEAGGRPASDPLLNLEGDALLFAFLMAGVVGGFVGGYFFRDLFPPRRKKDPIGGGAHVNTNT